MPSINIGKVSDTETSITISASWDASAGGDTVYFQRDGSNTSTESVSGTSGFNTHTFSGLSPGTTYFFEVAILDNNLDSVNDSASYTTDATAPDPDNPPYKPSNLSPSNGVEISDTTPTFSAEVSDPDGDDCSLVVETSPYSDFGGGIEVWQSSYVSSGSRAYVTADLSEGTWYWRAYTTSGDPIYDSSYTSVRDLDIRVRPNNWYWSTSKNSGDDFNLTASEWNSFTDRIDEFRQYVGLTDGTYSEAYVDGNFYAYQFNQAVNAISEMNPPISPPSTKVGISDVSNPSDADDILASDLNLLKESLNSV